MRYLLAFFFFLMLAGDNVGLSISMGAGLSLKNVLLYVIVGGIAVNAAVARNRPFELRAVSILFCMLVLYALVTWITRAFVLEDPAYQVKQAFITLKSSLLDQYLTFFIFFFGLLHVKDAVWTLRAILILVMIGNVITIVETMKILDLGLLPNPRKAGRFEGFSGQPNEYGLFLVLFFPACVAMYLKAAGAGRWLAGIGVLATAITLVLTGSRGAYVGLLAGAMIAAFYLRAQVSAQLVIRAGVAGAAVCVVVVLITLVTGYSDLYTDRFAGIDASSHVATSGRSTIWMEALSSMMENPVSFVSGYGFHAYESARGFRLATHNMYLSYLYDLGAVGLFLFVGVFACVLSSARSVVLEASTELKPYIVSLVFGLFGFLVACFFSDYHSTGYLLWAYVGTTMRMAIEVVRERADTGAEIEVSPPQPSGFRASQSPYAG